METFLSIGWRTFLLMTNGPKIPFGGLNVWFALFLANGLPERGLLVDIQSIRSRIRG
jgi:hypothetical protein